MSKKLSDLYNHGNDISKGSALKICSDHLRGKWVDIPESHFDLSVIQGGFVNRIFLAKNNVTEDKVILRLYGGKLLGSRSDKNLLRGGDLETEVLVFAIMSREKIGPALLGVFSGGRLEQFIEGHVLANEDVKSPTLMRAFARKLAHFHYTDVPISKAPKNMLETIETVFHQSWGKYVTFMQSIPPPPTPELKEAAEAVYNFDFTAYISWIKDLFPQIKTRIVFSHNDMNRANFLIKDEDVSDPEEKIVMLDFEFSCYNYRGCDIGMHFKNRTIDVKEFMKGNFSSAIPYPSEDERRYFIRAYLEVAYNHLGDLWDESLDNEFTLLLEAEFFAALYQLFFTSWIVRDHEKFKDMDFPMHPAVMMASMIKDLNEKRNLVQDLLLRGLV